LGQASNSGPPPVLINVALTGSLPINLSNPTLKVSTSYVVPTTRFRLGSQVGSLADQRTVAMTFTEDFASSFKIRVAAGGLQNIPGTFYNTESGFVSAALKHGLPGLPTAGLADSGTRLLAQFSNVPAGVRIYAPVFPDNSTNAQLVSTDRKICRGSHHRRLWDRSLGGDGS